MIDRQYRHDTSSESAAQEHLTFGEIVKLFLAKIHVFVIVFLGVVLVATLLAFVYPPVYKVSGTLLVRPNLEKPFLFTEDSSRVAQVNSKVHQEMINTAVNLITSTGVLRYVVAKRGNVDMTDDSAVAQSVNSLRSSISASPVSLSNLISVEYSGSQPAQVVSDLNELLDAFVRFNIEVQGFGKGGIQFF
jgi:uncharacterized protein involved in exopolysaccharide biosynthesis